MQRRVLLQGLGSLIVLSPVACGSDAAQSPAGGTDAGGQGGAGGQGNGGAGGQGGSGVGGAGGGVGGAGGGGQGGGEPLVCELTPQQTEGPFYLTDDLVRSDITEGKPGTEMTVVIHVVSMPDCTPIGDVAVDIWHADALGLYSGYPGQGHQGNVDTTGETFLRGTQISDADGRVEFTTIYPGWYPGRAVHIHFKVRLPGNLEVTSQMYFDDAFSDDVHGEGPYTTNGGADTATTQDGIYANTANADHLLVALEPGDPVVARLVIGIAPG